MLFFGDFEHNRGNIDKLLANSGLLNPGAGPESTSEAYFGGPRLLTINVGIRQKCPPKKVFFQIFSTEIQKF